VTAFGEAVRRSFAKPLVAVYNQELWCSATDSSTATASDALTNERERARPLHAIGDDGAAGARMW